MRDVYIIGVGMTRFAKHLDRSLRDLAIEGVEKALADAAISLDQIQAAYFSNSNWGFFSGQPKHSGAGCIQGFRTHGNSDHQCGKCVRQRRGPPCMRLG